MKPMDGLELLKSQRVAFGLSVIMMTAYATIETAVETMKSGAYDYVCKPFKVDELLLTVQRAMNYHKILSEKSAAETNTQDKVSFREPDWRQYTNARSLQHH